MMKEHHASRTIVKSPPELWAECSDAGSLARHIGEFGEIRITRLDPETTVAWEGERASGTVEIEPSAWGTKVTLTAWSEGDEAAQMRSDQVGPREDDQLVPPETARRVGSPVVEDDPDVTEVCPVDPVLTEVGPVDPVLTEVGPVGPSVTWHDQVGPPVTGNRLAEEVRDAKVEETSTEPHPAVAADPVRIRRWKRVLTLTRALFQSRGASDWEAGFSERPPVALARPQVTGITEPPPSTETGEPPPIDGAEPPPECAKPPPTDGAEPPPTGDAEQSSPEGAEPPVPEVATTEVPEHGDVQPSIDPAAVLSSALESLGQAHHRPFSRA